MNTLDDFKPGDIVYYKAIGGKRLGQVSSINTSYVFVKFTLDDSYSRGLDIKKLQYTSQACNPMFLINLSEFMRRILS